MNPTKRYYIFDVIIFLIMLVITVLAAKTNFNLTQGDHKYLFGDAPRLKDNILSTLGMLAFTFSFFKALYILLYLMAYKINTTLVKVLIIQAVQLIILVVVYLGMLWFAYKQFKL